MAPEGHPRFPVHHRAAGAHGGAGRRGAGGALPARLGGGGGRHGRRRQPCGAALTYRGAGPAGVGAPVQVQPPLPPRPAQRAGNFVKQAVTPSSEAIQVTKYNIISHLLAL